MEPGKVDIDRLGCSTIAFRHFSLEAALKSIAELGFEYVDIGTMPGFCDHFNFFTATEEEEADFIRQVRASGLRVHTLTTQIGHYNAPDADREALLACAMRNLRVAKELGAYGVNVNNGAYRARETYPLEKDILIVASALREVAEEAHRLGLVMMIEAPHKGNLIRDADEAMRLVESIGHANAYLIFDSNHHEAAGWGMRRAVERFGDRIALVHLRDGRGRENCYPLGAGAIRFDDMFAALDEAGYKGRYHFEFTDAGATIEDNKTMLARSVDYLKQLTWRRDGDER